MGKISYPEYLAANNPERANEVFDIFGYPPVNEFDDQVSQMHMLMDEFGENAQGALIAVHPDYEMIVDNYKQTPEFKELIEKKQTPVQQPYIVQNSPASEIQATNEVSRNGFNNTLRDVLLIVMAFWLVKQIVAKD